MYDSSYTLQNTGTNISSIFRKILQAYEDGSQNMFVFIWDQHDYLIYSSNQMKEKIAMLQTDVHDIKWKDILPESTVLEIQHHFNESDKQLCLSPFRFTSEESEDNVFRGFIAPFQMKGDLFYICQLSNGQILQEWERLLADTEKLILSSQMAASLVHEIRNPLTSLKGFIQLVQSGIEQKEKYYDVIISEIEKLEKITMELLQMSRPTGDDKLNVCVDSMIDDVVFLLENQMDMKRIKFVVQIESGLFTECHASQMKQVFINLIKNGAEAMEKVGEIKIHAFQKEKNVHIEIIDEGIGISSDVIAELNNPFYTTKIDGTGLGLVVTNHILNDHKGQLKVSTEENKGTVFTVILPILQS